MICITVSRGHPITITAADEPRFHFAKLISGSENVMQLQLRKRVPDIASLNISSIIIETFAQLGDVRAGFVGIEIDCRNISSPRSRLLKLALLEPLSLTFRVTPES